MGSRIPEDVGPRDPLGRVLFESDVAVTAGIGTTVRHCIESLVGEEFPNQSALVQDLALVTSELVANATGAASQRIRVRVVAEGDTVTVAVSDDGPGLPQLRHPGADDPTGRGLLLVDAISDAWGIEPMHPQGKTVWARCVLASSHPVVSTDAAASCAEPPAPDQDLGDAPRARKSSAGRSGSWALNWLRTVAAGTEMGDAVLARDWTATPIGPPASWSVGLRNAVGVCLSSRFPMMVLWGPDLIGIYNDGLRPILGTVKHPGGLGAPAKAVWSEIWDEIGPLFSSVMSTGEATWAENQLLVLERNGFPEECYFTYSYSPLFDDDGTVGGVLVTANETTQSVVAQRRLATLARLSRAMLDATDPTEVCVAATNALAIDADDLAATDVYLRAGEPITLVASNRRVAVSPASVEELLRVTRTRHPMAVGATPDATRAVSQIALPLGQPDEGIDGVLVAALNAQRPLDRPFDEYLGLIASTISRALDSTYRQSTALGGYRHISDTLQASMLTPAVDLPTVAARYLPAVAGLAVGGDWYDVIDLDPQRRALVVGDCVGHGLDAATTMAQLRVAARTLLLEGRDPAAALCALDTFSASVEGAFCTSMMCAIFDTETRVLTYSRAGHPPPLLIHRHQAQWLDDATGLPLGVDPDRARHNAISVTDEGDTLIMYTDGLIERRDESLTVGFDRLAAAALSLHAFPVQRIADDLLRGLQPENTRDDVVLVVKRLTRVGRRPAPTNPS